MLRVGLTGGIASGKTTVARMFAARGVTVVDADAIAHELCQPGAPGYRAIREEFGESVLQADGNIDRPAMRELIFRDGDSRRRLESVLHPLILRELLRRADAASGPYCILVIPLLVEAGLADVVDRVLVVEADQSQRLGWLCERDGIDNAAARRIMAAQTDDASRRALADDVITNDGDEAKLEQRIDALHRFYTDLADT